MRRKITPLFLPITAEEKRRREIFKMQLHLNEFHACHLTEVFCKDKDYIV